MSADFKELLAEYNKKADGYIYAIRDALLSADKVADRGADKNACRSADTGADNKANSCTDTGTDKSADRCTDTCVGKSADRCTDTSAGKNAISRKFLYDNIKGYVCSKFMLDQNECESCDIAKLSELSVAKAAKIPQGAVSEQDLSMNCAGISSVETKKILLLIALQRALDIQLPSDAATDIHSLEELTDAVYNHL